MDQNPVMFTTSQSGLQQINNDAVQMVVYQRQLVPPFVTQTLSSASPDALPTVFETVTPSNAALVIRTKLLSYDQSEMSKEEASFKTEKAQAYRQALEEASDELTQLTEGMSEQYKVIAGEFFFVEKYVSMKRC